MGNQRSPPPLNERKRKLPINHNGKENGEREEKVERGVFERERERKREKERERERKRERKRKRSLPTAIRKKARS